MQQLDQQNQQRQDNQMLLISLLWEHCAQINEISLASLKHSQLRT